MTGEAGGSAPEPEELIRIGYFEAIRSGNIEGLGRLLAEDVDFGLGSGARRYKGRDAVVEHIRDFLGARRVRDYVDLRFVTDRDRRAVVAQFRSETDGRSGSYLSPMNCYAFEFDEAWRVARVDIYA